MLIQTHSTYISLIAKLLVVLRFKSMERDQAWVYGATSTNGSTHIHRPKGPSSYNNITGNSSSQVVCSV